MGDETDSLSIELDDNLAVHWIDHWAAQPECNQNISSSIFLASCRRDMRMGCGLPNTPPPTACYARLMNYCAVNRPSNTPMSSSNFWDPVIARAPDALRDAVISPGNIGGNMLGSLMALDSLYHSLPPNFFVTVKGGEWELFDANKSARANAFGKKGKARFPPRMVLRLKGAALPKVPVGGYLRNGQLRVPVAGAQSVAQALRISGLNKFQPISDKAYKALAGRRFAAGGAVGAALAFGPTLYTDVKAAGGVSRIYNDHAAREQFLLTSARNQSTNAIGFGAGIAVGAALVAVGVASAPVLLVAGLVAGVAAQTGFVSFGGDEWAHDVMKDILR